MEQKARQHQEHHSYKIGIAIMFFAVTVGLASFISLGQALTGTQGQSLRSVIRASLAGVWQLPFTDRAWEIDPEFDFGTPYGGSLHLAEDGLAPAGTAVRAAANGKVVQIANFQSSGNYGGIVLIDHQNVDGSKVVSIYGHIDPSRFKVSVGQQVNRGDLLGYVGDFSVNGHWRTHVHFGIRKGGYTGAWAYYGFGDEATLRQWERPSAYVAARAGVTDVARMPLTSRDRYETAVGVSNWLYPQNSSAQTVLLASGENHVGPLVATPLTRYFKAPLLLTYKSGLPSSTQKELTRVAKPGATVYILGDNTWMSDAVEQRVRSLGFTTQRLGSTTAESISIAAAKLLPTSSTTFVVSKTSFADAVSAATPATTLGLSVLVSDPGSLGNELHDYLSSSSITKVVIVGGTQALSSAAEQELTAMGLNVERIGGADRYATSRLVAERFFATPELLAMATGEKFPDSLVGAALAANSNGVLLLTPASGLAANVQQYISAIAESVRLAFVLGGTAALPTTIDLQIGGILN